MITKRDINRIISVLMLLSFVYIAAGYMFGTDPNGVRVLEAVSGATSTNTVTTNPAPSPTANAAVNVTAAPTANAAANVTAAPTANAAVNVTVAPTANAAANATAAPTANAAVNVTVAPTANAAANVTAAPTANATANATTNATANVTTNATANATANITSTPVPPGEPGITSYSPSTPVSDVIGAPQAFSITVNQTVNVIWLINGVQAGTDTGVTTSSYTNTSAAQGTWNVTVVASNDNGNATQNWDWVVTVPGPPSILASDPPGPVNDIVGTQRTFRITVNQTGDVAWLMNDSVVQNNSNVTTANYTNISAVPGTFNITAVFTSIYGTISSNWIWNVKNPPENVTNLTIIAAGPTYINWTWDAPADESFNGTQILIDGALKDTLPGSLNYYNASGFIQGTSHNISVIAVDNLGNKAIPPWPASTGITTNTPIGSEVAPSGLPSGITVTFANITEEGITTVSSEKNPPVVPGFMPLGPYMNITTTANFTGPVTITLEYTQPPDGFNKSNVRLYSLNNSVWEDMTTNMDENIVTGVVSGLALVVAGIYPPPNITVIREPSTEIAVRDTIFFNITIDQAATVNWTVNGNMSLGPLIIPAGEGSNFTFNSTAIGNYSIVAVAENINGTSSRSWNVTVHPVTFFKGNRIWDGSKPDEFSLKYTWDSMSFSGFYYDINEDVGDESITMSMSGYKDRTISSGNISYTTSSQEVDFGYKGFGKYDVVGFMADKYFAGYTANTKPPEPTTGIDPVSTISQGHLYKVLIDDDIRRTISLGSTLALKDGYVVKAKDIDLNARTMLISLLKDGTEVDSTPLSAGQTYVYTKDDIPLIMLRFENVFSGQEIQTAFMRGLFQISENYDTVSTGNDFGIMEITSISDKNIIMRNRASLNLGAGNTIDLMGNLKIIVADDPDVRFALSVERTGEFEVRSNVYRESDPIDTWTPYNFGMNIGKTVLGFYYDLDKGIGEETLHLAAPLAGSRTIPDGGLLYTTTPQEVNFGYSGFGSYDVIGFMADKYFAGYTTSSRPPGPTTSIDPISVITSGQLHKILIDDDTRRTFSVGGTIALKEGYVLKAKDIDLNARTILLSLLKDGVEVDVAPLSAGQTYVYTKNTGGLDIPIILMRFDNVFSGQEIQSAFIKGLFQISENYTTINAGNRFGRMVIRSVGADNIQMSNDGSISLSKGANESLMGNITVKVGDTTDNSLRFYFAVDVTAEMIASQLIIGAPARATAGDAINISVTAGGNPIDGAALAINSSNIGQTSINGTLNYTLPRTMKGIYNITANRSGYDSATRNIEVLEYIERKLGINAPIMANQSETITIVVTSNNTNVSNATVSFDNTTIGFTNISGALNYTLNTSGIHNLSASKTGYINVTREINIRAPFSEYKALDINITPDVVFTGENAVIKSNITNAGTKNDTLPVELIINGTSVDNRSVTLAQGEIKEINFTRKEARAGNYTVEILGQKRLLEVKPAPLIWNLILVVAIVTVLGIIAIYLLTTKNKISFEEIRKKLKAQLDTHLSK